MKVLLFLIATCAFAEVHTLTLRQTLERATDQNPEVALARFETTRAQAQTMQLRDPFSLKLGVGSGLAYTYGMPSTIDGNAPSIFQARGQMALFDRPQTYRVEQAREAEKGAAMDVALKQQEVAYRVYSAFLDAEHAARSASAAELQFRSLQQVKQYTDVRVADGREIRLESQRADLNARTAQNAADEFAYFAANAEASLAQLLGYPAGDRVHPALEERTLDALPISLEQAVAAALAESTDVRRLESNLRAKQLEVKSFQAAKLPRINLVSQYATLAKFNNFLEFYPRFQRNNFQIGASIEIPIFTGKAPAAGKALAQTDIDKLRVELTRTKSRIATDIDQSYRDVQRAENTRSLRRAALDFAREELSVAMLQNDEGRTTMAQVEALRAAEQEQWIHYYESQRSVEIARLNVRRATGSILAGVR
jgi:outer membrane protein TolC